MFYTCVNIVSGTDVRETYTCDFFSPFLKTVRLLSFLSLCMYTDSLEIWLDVYICVIWHSYPLMDYFSLNRYSASGYEIQIVLHVITFFKENKKLNNTLSKLNWISKFHHFPFRKKKKKFNRNLRLSTENLANAKTSQLFKVLTGNSREYREKWKCWNLVSRKFDTWKVSKLHREKKKKKIL